jgi:hypothetical protein
MKIRNQLLFVLIIFAVIKLFALLGYALTQRNFDLISTAFDQYLDCAHSSSREDCILLFRKYANTELLLSAEFVWYTSSVVIPTIFFFSYRQVRELWTSIITCGSSPRKTTVSLENMKNAQQTNKIKGSAARAIEEQL